MNQYQRVLDYIEKYWDECLFVPHGFVLGSVRNLLLHLGRLRLPYPSVSPNHLYFAGSQYYWDTYFILLGLIDSGRGDLARGMVDNLAYLYRRFGLIPARNTLMSVGRTQSPFLTSMIWEVYESGAADKEWLDRLMKLAVTEYEKVWNGGQRAVREIGLNRYQPRYLRSLLTTYESGWDVSSRFAHGRTDLIPVDLNCLLYKYETDFIKWAKMRGDDADVTLWKKRADLRRTAINNYHWDEETGFYYDYDLSLKRHDPFRTLAGYFALWSGVANKKQAKACLNQLGVFEQPHGLATTEKITWKHRQWDYPNGWPPLHYIVIKGINDYGFEKDASRLANKWLNLQAEVFERTGKLWEKYDVVRGRAGRRGRYPTQEGFTWTSGVFLRILKEIKN